MKHAPPACLPTLTEFCDVHIYFNSSASTVYHLSRARVCVLYLIYFGDSPMDQGETCTSLCSVFRGLHFAAHFFCPSEPTGVTQEGVNTGTFSSIMFFECPTPSCGACLHCLSRKGFRCPFPSSTMKSSFVFSRNFQLFTAFHFQVRV